MAQEQLAAPLVEGAQFWHRRQQRQFRAGRPQLLARRQGRNRSEAEQARRRQPLLAQVEAVDQGQDQQAVEHRALPAAENFDRTGRKPAQQRIAPRPRQQWSALGQQGIEAAGPQLQLPLNQGQHRAQIGRFRQAIAPTALQRLQHRRADAGIAGQIPQAEALGFSLLPQMQAGGDQGIHRWRLQLALLQGAATPPAEQASGQRGARRGQIGWLRACHSW